MTDLAIKLATPAYHQKCVADAFHARQSRDSHGMNAGSPHIATFHAGYDDAEAQYKSWHKARFAMSQQSTADLGKEH